MKIQENYNIVNLLNDMQNSIIVEMKQSIKQEIDDKFNGFEKKFDNKLDALDRKFEDKFNSLDEKFESKLDALEQKFDNKLDALDRKFEDKFNSLEKKVDNNSAHIVKILNTISIMQKDIAFLRDDVETIYCLEKDSRKQLKRLL